MNNLDKTKEELRIELKKLQMDYNSLKELYLRDINDYRHTKETLQKSEEKWRKLVTIIPDYIALHDPDGRYLFLNHYAEGFSEEDVIGKSVYNFVSADSKEVFRRNFEACLKTRQNQSFVYSAYGNNKDLRIYETHLVPILENGKIAGVMAFAVDITERINAEVSLRERESGFRSLFENSLIGISAVSHDGRILHANLACATMYGYESPDIMIAEVSNVEQLYANPLERKELLRILNLNGLVAEMEVEMVRRDGSRFFVLISANEVRDTGGKLLFSQGTHIDLSERRKFEKKIRDASYYARNLIEASLDPLVTINIEGRITDVNLATEKVTGIKRESLIGSDFADYFTEPERARMGYGLVFLKGVVKDYPLTIRHKNGQTTDVLYNATLFKNEAGEVQGVFAAARDITERKKMEAELRNSKKSLETLNRHLQEVRENERSQIALNLHDDFGQRLTALSLDIAWLKSRMGVQSSGVMKKLDEMRLMINESIESIREVSSFLRPAILYDLGLVSAFEFQLKKFEKQSGIKCQFSYDPEDIVIDNNISLILYRILQESLTNIIRHSEASVTEVDIRLVKKKIEMIIKDNGKGIETEKINSLTSMGITGLKERVRSVDGNVFIKGEKGSGTTIKISIPLKNREKL